MPKGIHPIFFFLYHMQRRKRKKKFQTLILWQDAIN
jgi:hypothetical protein